MVKSGIKATVSGGMPGPLSRTLILPRGDDDADHRRDAGLLAGIERVVDQLLQDDERPVVRLVTGLGDELFGEQNSSLRLVLKVVRGAGAVMTRVPLVLPS